MYLVHQTNFLIGKKLDHTLKEANHVSFSQFLILMSLGCKTESSQRDIAEFLFLTEATVSRHTEQLRKDGLIDRKDHPESRREYIITLTQKGKAELESAQALINTALEGIFAPVAKPEREIMSIEFTKILQGLHENHQ